MNIILWTLIWMAWIEGDKIVDLCYGRLAPGPPDAAAAVGTGSV